MFLQLCLLTFFATHTLGEKTVDNLGYVINISKITIFSLIIQILLFKFFMYNLSHFFLFENNHSNFNYTVVLKRWLLNIFLILYLYKMNKNYLIFLLQNVLYSFKNSLLTENI